MRSVVSFVAALMVTAAVVVAQQPPARPMSPEGSAQTQVLGKWSKGERPSFAAGRENYTGGRWIEIVYGRPLQRGRDLFGSGADYGKSLNDVGTAGLPAPPVWRAGANVSTRLKTEVPLVFGGKRSRPASTACSSIVNSPSQWTLIISSWGAMAKFDPKNKEALWGAYNYTADRDVARVPMKVEKLPFAVDQLTWTFLDMTTDGGRVALMWANTMASTPFKAVAQ